MKCPLANMHLLKTKYNQLLDYKATHPQATIQYHASYMILITDNDDTSLVLPAACSFIASQYYLNKHMLDYSKGTPTPNGLILTEFKTIKTIISSSAEAKTESIFENTQNVIPLRIILKTVFLNPQPKERSPIITYNLTSLGILIYSIKLVKSKNWYMRYHWFE